MIEPSGLLCPRCGARLDTTSTRRSRDKTALIRTRICRSFPEDHQFGSVEIVLGIGTRAGQMEELLPHVQLIARGGLREHYEGKRAEYAQEERNRGSAGYVRTQRERRSTVRVTTDPGRPADAQERSTGKAVKGKE